MLSEEEMYRFPWRVVEEMLKRLREVVMLEWVCCIRPEDPSRGLRSTSRPQGAPLTKVIRHGPL
jgi:hypothetical protein